MTYFTFVEQATPPERKTKIWAVLSTSTGALLGRIRWENGWRRYALWPEPQTLFDSACLREICVFLDTEMLKRR